MEFLTISEIFDEWFESTHFEDFVEISNKNFNKVDTMKENKKRYQYFKYFINWDYFDVSKLSIPQDILNQKSISTNKYPLIKLIANYQYTEKFFDKLLISTPFIKLTNDPFKFVRNKLLKPIIFLDLNKYNANVLVSPLRKYDQFIRNKLTELGYKEQKSLMPNMKGTDCFEYLPLYFYYDKTQNIVFADIINYNISKEYPPVEQFNKIEFEALRRFVKIGKEIRFLLYPITWIQQNNKLYVTKLMIKIMEVKYEGRLIKSIFDEKTSQNCQFIKEVTI